MPQADFTSGFSSNNGRSNFPRLRLQKNEIARVCIVSKPRYEYVHWLEAPQIVNMAPTYKTIQTRDGAEMNVVNTRKVNTPICHGHSEILKERGVDGENCMACLMARDRPDIFRPPSPRYALNIIRYGLRPGGGWSDISQPFGITTLIWAFSGKVMDKLIQFRGMGAAYEDLRMVDLLLSCDDQNFQKPYSQGEFTPFAPAYWTTNEDVQKYTAMYLEQNHATDEDLDEVIGKKVNDNWLSDDIQRIVQGWDVVRAYESRGQGGPALGQGFGQETFQQGMSQVQQQFGQQQPQLPPPPQMQPQFAPPPSVQQPVAAANEQLWEPQWQQPNPAAPPAPPAPPETALQQAAAPDLAAVAAQQAAALAQAGVPQNLLPPTLQTAPVQPVSPTASALSATTVPAPQTPPPAQQSTAQPMQPPPSGLEGLGEYMKAQTAAPAAPPTLPTPPAQAPAGGHYSFEDLVKLGKQQQ